MARRLKTSPILILLFSLSGCGGAGGEVASIAAPSPNAQSIGQNLSVVKALAQAPAWTTGNYQAIALVDSNGGLARAAPGSVSLAVDTSAKTYALTVTAGSITVEPTTFHAEAPRNPCNCFSPNFYLGSTVKAVTQWSDGVARPGTDTVTDVTLGQFDTSQKIQGGMKQLDSFLQVRSVPNRHVSLGGWGLTEYQLNPDGTRAQSTSVSNGVFVFGDRTVPGDIPVGGSARYTVETPDRDQVFGLSPVPSTTFSVDFAARTIAANVSHSLVLDLFPDGVSCCTGGEKSFPDPKTKVGTAALSTTASGKSGFTPAGSFDIALSGTGLVRTDGIDKTPVPDIAVPLSGSISGAFFGPRASELGGTYILPSLNPDGRVDNQSGAFTAVQTPP